MGLPIVINPKTGNPYPQTIVLGGGTCPIENQANVSSVGGPVAVNLPAVPPAIDDSILAVVDTGGAAGANNITVNGNGNTIDGSASVTIAKNFGAALFQWDNTNATWHQLTQPTRQIGTGPQVQLAVDAPSSGGGGASPVTTTAYVAIGATPATAGLIRTSSNGGGWKYRNAANTGNLWAINTDGADQLFVGADTNGQGTANSPPYLYLGGVNAIYLGVGASTSYQFPANGHAAVTDADGNALVVGEVAMALAANQTTSNAALTSISGTWLLNVAAGEVWYLVLDLSTNQTNAVGIKFGLGGTATVSQIEGWCVGAAASAAAITASRITALAAATGVAFNAFAGDGFVRLWAKFTVSGAGTIVPQYLATGGSGVAKVYAASMLNAKIVGSSG